MTTAHETGELLIRPRPPDGKESPASWGPGGLADRHLTLTAARRATHCQVVGGAACPACASIARSLDRR
eukprot:scaffold2093_cov425-Prasinococcus_capsulatus_cf.AAC.9